MNDLEKYFTENTNRSIHKWQHYFDIYDSHFSRYRGTDVHLVELGVSEGGSLQMWKEHFEPDCKIYGVIMRNLIKSYSEFGNIIFAISVISAIMLDQYNLTMNRKIIAVGGSAIRENKYG